MAQPPPQLPHSYQAALDRLIATLPRLLGNNLYSCVLYGSAVRGDITPGVSDLNLLLVLNESTPDAHSAIADALDNKIRIEPFVLTRKALERSVEAFATKFRSIKRDYRVLHGEDPLANINVNEVTVRFLAEQAVRNLRLRSVHAYIIFQNDRRRYLSYLHNIEAKLFVDLSEVLRLNGTEIPHDFSDRIPILGNGFNTDVSILEDLLHLRQRQNQLNQAEMKTYHSRLYRLLDHVIRWIESTWPPQS